MEKKMNINLKLLDSDSQISKAILSALSEQIDQIFKNIDKKIAPTLKEIVSKALKSEPEYLSLKGGKLRYEMGIADTSSVDLVIQKLVDTLTITNNGTKISRSFLSSGFSLTMMKSDDLNGVIGDQVALVVDKNRGYELPWLQWLLLRGNEVIVQNYSVKIGPNPASRTGNAIMVQSNRNWRVPPEFVGTQTNNWTTRAIAAAETEILQALQSAIRNSL